MPLTGSDWTKKSLRVAGLAMAIVLLPAIARAAGEEDNNQKGVTVTVVKATKS